MATSMPSPKGPYTLVTVNTAPERAKLLIGHVTSDLSDRYIIIHAGNCERIEEVEETVRRINPDLLCCASMWSPQESEEIQRMAKQVKIDLKTFALPQGLQVQKGPGAVVELLKKEIPRLIDLACS